MTAKAIAGVTAASFPALSSVPDQVKMSVSLVRCAAVAATLAAALSAQGFNCRLLSNVNPLTGATASRNNYAGMWGMVVNGRELAILPARSGTYVYDCTNPSSPVLLGSVPGTAPSTSTYWRESTGFGNYAYSCSEHQNVQAIDVSVTPPVLAMTFGGRGHSIQVDASTRRLWVNGGAINGARIYDLAASATNPPLLTSYTSAYVHDSYPYNGYCYLAQISAGNLRILDTSAFPTLTVVSTTTTPGAATHNAWTNKDATLMVTTDETTGGCLTFYDITNKATPIQLSTWCAPGNAIVHNAFIRGKVVHMSSYTAGYHAVDISEPANPRLIASYDTNALRSGTGYTGCWGCYPLQPSGAVYLADMEFGLFVVEPTCGVPSTYGTGTAGTAGKTPEVDYAGGFAQVGRSTFQLECSEMASNAPLVLLVATGAASLPIFGINLNVDLSLPHIVVPAGANAQGKLSVNVPMPVNAGAAGASIYAQVITVDAAGPQGLAASKGFRVAICP
jgi:choice-of-anchor B domain-containing protein